MKKKQKDPNVYPTGLNAKKVAEIIAYYDARQDLDLRQDSDHEVLSEPTSWVEVPSELVPEVRKLIAKPLTGRNQTGLPWLSTIIGPRCPGPFSVATKMSPGEVLSSVDTASVGMRNG